MIEIRNLTKSFPNVKAVNDLTIDIKGGINGLVGENGAGKTTLFRLIADVYQADSGTITIDKLVNSSKEAKENLFFLPDDPYFERNSKVSEVLTLYESLFPLDIAKCKATLKDLNLPLNRSVNTFSKGMRRQLFLVIGLSMNCQYYLLDEAFDGVDPLTQEKIKQLILDNQEEKTYVISSHNIGSLEKICSHFIILSKGVLSKEEEKVDMGNTYTKFQIMVSGGITQEELEKVGLHVVSFKQIGSIYHVVFLDQNPEEMMKKCFPVTLMENIPIDAGEIITLEMRDAQKGGNE